MIVYKCDGCGKEQEKPFAKVAKIIDNSEPRCSRESSYDLCDKCAKEFVDWFGFRKKRTRGEQE